MKKSTCFALAFLGSTFFISGQSFADDIIMANNSENTIKQIDCYNGDSNESNSLVLENLKPHSSMTISPEKTPEFMCQRLVYTLDNGEVLQFYVEHEVGSLERIDFDINEMNIYSEEKILPLITCINEDYIEQNPAGLPFFIIIQFLAGGHSTEKWQTWTTPGKEFDTYKEYFMDLGNQSWSLTENGIEMKGNIPVAMTMDTPIAIPLISPLFAEFEQSEFIMQHAMMNGEKVDMIDGEKINMYQALDLLLESQNPDNKMILTDNKLNMTLSIANDLMIMHLEKI